jgi:hypothetical protein
VSHEYPDLNPWFKDVRKFDFSKAFDTVPHDKLMYKLEKYGIKGDFHKWLTSFLTKREMRVIIKGEHACPISAPTLPDTLSRSEARCGLLYSLFGDRVGSHLQRGKLETSHTLAGH